MTLPNPPKFPALTGRLQNQKTSAGPQFLRRFLRQPSVVLSLIWLGTVIACAVFADVLAPHDPLENHFTPGELLQGPSPDYWLGSDENGRDVFSRLLFGARIALVVGFGSVVIAMIIGVPIGLLLGYRGGWWDRIGTRFVDILDALPGMLVAFAVIAILGRGLPALMLAIGLIFAMNFARMARAVTLAERGKLYVDAAKVSGIKEVSILFRQILPNLTGPLVIQGSILVGAAIMIESMLSFLGIGLQSDVPSWGGLLGAAAVQLAVQPFLAIPPGIVIVLTVLSFNMIGDGVNDALAGDKRVKPLRRKAPRSAQAGPHSGRGTESDLVAGEPTNRPVLEVSDLSVVLNTSVGSKTLIRDINLTIQRGEIVGLIGESGSGKSTLSRAILGLMAPGIGIESGKVLLNGLDIAGLGERDLRDVRGSQIAAVFQDPMASLSPVHTIGKQLMEPLRTHLKMNRAQARQRAVELLLRVGVANAETRLNDYPHQFSGGMAQRVAIAIALASDPEIIIADEATSALDVTTQAQVIDLLLDLRAEFNLSILFITHGLGVAAEACDRVVVMYKGEIVEANSVYGLFDKPQHPYTVKLLEANPALSVRNEAKPGAVDVAVLEKVALHVGGTSHTGEPDERRPHPASLQADALHREESSLVGDSPLLRVQDLALSYGNSNLLRSKKHVVEDVSFDIDAGTIFGLVGESGSGKSTIGRAILRLLPIAEGKVEFNGTDISTFGSATPLSYRRQVQAVFQDPSMSLNPRQPVSYSLTSALARHGVSDRGERESRAEEAFAQVGLLRDHLTRFPAELSGGQQQRVAIARALVLKPSLVVCDEAVSALDVLTQKQIMELLADLQEETGVSYLFIAHDMGLVKNICDRVGVMRSGRMVEVAETEAIFYDPQHPYTKRLLGATPADHPAGREERRRVRLAFNQAHAEGKLPVP